MNEQEFYQHLKENLFKYAIPRLYSADLSEDLDLESFVGDFRFKGTNQVGDNYENTFRYNFNPVLGLEKTAGAELLVEMSSEE